jgi:hypothetical protein
LQHATLLSSDFNIDFIGFQLHQGLTLIYYITLMFEPGSYYSINN